MKECYFCGITEEKAVLYSGIHRTKGFVDVCRKCFFKDKMPLVDKKEVNLENINSRQSVRERLSKMAHLNTSVEAPKKAPKRFIENYENIHLQDLVERNLKKEISAGVKSPPDLIDNFNWVVMRKRRALKISKEKMSEDIKESLIALESLEKGSLPRDYKNLVKKVESYLGIRIFKDHSIKSGDIILESKVPSGILIEDLKKKEKEEKEKYIDAKNLSLKKIESIYGVPKEVEKKEFEIKDVKPEKEKKWYHFWKKSPKENPFKDRNLKLKGKKELTDEEVSKIIWGK